MSLVLPVLTLPLAAPSVSPAALAVATIWQEARGEPYEGKLAVAEVIRDRTLFKYNSDGTLLGTLLKPFQFSGWNTEDPNRLKSLWVLSLHPEKLTGAQRLQLDECAAAWMEAVTMRTVTAKGAVLYHAHTMKRFPAWAKRATEVHRVGAHVFYKDPAFRAAQ